MSAQRAAALGEASSPGASATLIASCRAEPFAYASISLDRQSAAFAERRRPALTNHAIRPASAAAPSRIHSQSRLPAPELVAALGDVVGVAVSVAVAVWVAVAV